LRFNRVPDQLSVAAQKISGEQSVANSSQITIYQGGMKKKLKSTTPVLRLRLINCRIPVLPGQPLAGDIARGFGSLSGLDCLRFPLALFGLGLARNGAGLRGCGSGFTRDYSFSSGFALEYECNHGRYGKSDRKTRQTDNEQAQPPTLGAPTLVFSQRTGGEKSGGIPRHQVGKTQRDLFGVAEDASGVEERGIAGGADPAGCLFADDHDGTDILRDGVYFQMQDRSDDASGSIQICGGPIDPAQVLIGRSEAADPLGSKKAIGAFEENQFDLNNTRFRSRSCPEGDLREFVLLGGSPTISSEHHHAYPGLVNYLIDFCLPIGACRHAPAVDVDFDPPRF